MTAIVRGTDLLHRRAAALGRLVPRPRVFAAMAVGLLIAATAHRFAGVPALTGSGLIGAALRLAVPIGLAALGALWSERAGVTNLGLEGMMILGTWSAAWVGATHGVWPAVLAGAVGGALGGLLHAVATVTFGVDQVISGVAINLLTPGLVRYLSTINWEGLPQAGATQSPPIRGTIGTFTVPVLAGGHIGDRRSPDLLGAVERRDWFVLSDAAGLLRGLLAEISWFTLLAAVLFVLSWLILWRTPFGLRLRFIGENPGAADSLGVAVYRTKYVAVVVSGALAGLGGAFLVTVASGLYREGQTAGRGYIGLAAMIFGNWRPGGTAAGSLLFGYSDALQLRQSGAVRGLVLCAGLAFLVIGVVLLRRRRRASVVSLLAGAAAIGWFGLVHHVPPQLVYATPYAVTLVVLVVSARRLRMPAADGVPYRRGVIDV
ncbi:simple sugar transport system permease protein [Actinomadura pelletieri DSM 43383]|uniref:Simple sugar transport system permease protein n=1 Tax=Actinomadura pelletieri DSM 43383 TaxID=1120940 RepID=A0A495QXH5_9ACTN|nr:ABC transporter permease [Actinomadura pelletieri]RKS78767.1 simple sugar transport system permease protein [Actinomadura pelletieri DSM 43383]